ncbi:MAG: diguanylate cyclase [Deltaproteobacteria bacterium]|nr:diguanylate cyclase [Deltaproteobacteria bacterium]
MKFLDSFLTKKSVHPGDRGSLSALENYFFFAILVQIPPVAILASIGSKASVTAGVGAIVLFFAALLLSRRARVSFAILCAWTGFIIYGVIAGFETGLHDLAFLAVLGGLPLTYLVNWTKPRERLTSSIITMVILVGMVLLAPLNPLTGQETSITHWSLALFHISMLFGIIAIPISNLFRRNTGKISVIKRLEKEVETASRTDPLTLLFNRMGIMERIRAEVVRFRRNQRQFSMVMAGLDDFEELTKKYGHEIADQALVEIANMFDDVVRGQDLASRWEAEMFLLFLPETGIEGGVAAAERLKERVKSRGLNIGGRIIKVTMTFGISTFDGGMTLDECILAAEEAHKLGRKAGGNKIVPMSNL